MKFLLDENISNSLYRYLKNQNFDVKKIGIDEPSGIPDRQVIQISIDEDRILITRDCGDIGEFIYKNNIKIKGVICIKGSIAGFQEVDAFSFLQHTISSLEKKFIIINKVKGKEIIIDRIRNL